MTMSRIYDFVYSKKIYWYFWVVVSVGLVIISIAMMYKYVPNGEDWAVFFRPGIIRMFSGISPYTVIADYPPWALLVLSPLALFPPRLGSAILVIASPIMFSFVAYKLGAKFLPIIFFVFSPPVVYNTFNINIEWMPALGLLMPPQIGLFFVLIKPQSGIGVAVYWFFEAWQKARIKGVINVFWPVAVAYLISFALYGFWPLNALSLALAQAVQPNGDVNVFPWAVPLGLGILFYAIWNKLKTLSISASPLLSPYVLMHSWSSFLLGLVNYPVVSISACILAWIITAWAWTN
jgi:hypothetical protein